MPSTRNTGGKNRIGSVLAVGLSIVMMVGLLLGLAACRGFFGQAPIALLVVTLPANVQQVPVTVTFDISGSTDPDGTIASYELDYGDGSAKKTGTTIPTGTFTHAYTVGGVYTVTLTVMDNDGRTGMASRTIIIGQELIVFASERSGANYGIYRMMADGSGEAVIYDSIPNDELFPDVVRGTRDKIAYAKENGTSWNIHTMTITGVGITTLTTQTASNAIQPSWSYNGSKIAYASNAAQTPSATTWGIYWIDAEGTLPPTQLATTQTPSWAPAYSPVDEKIVFVSEKDNTSTGSALWFWNGTTATQLHPTTTSHAYRYGDASPSGFPSGLTTALNLPTGAGISKPAWSPDGTKIAFSSNKAGAGKSDIYVIDIDTTTGTASNERTLEAYVEGLTATTFTNTITDPTKDEFCPYWLEDKSGLAFVRLDGTTYKICKVSFSDGSVTTLTSTGTGNATPAAIRR